MAKMFSVYIVKQMSPSKGRFIPAMVMVKYNPGSTRRRSVVWTGSCTRGGNRTWNGSLWGLKSNNVHSSNFRGQSFRFSRGYDEYGELHSTWSFNVSSAFFEGARCGAGYFHWLFLRGFWDIGGRAYSLSNVFGVDTLSGDVHCRYHCDAFKFIISSHNKKKGRTSYL